MITFQIYKMMNRFKKGCRYIIESWIDSTWYDVVYMLTNIRPSNGKSKHLVLNIIDKKSKDDCPRDADGLKLSPYELYCLSKIECNHLHLNKFWLHGGSMLKKEKVLQMKKNKISSKRKEWEEQIHQKFKAKITSFK